ncbi:MAG: hypothetical protein IJH12_10625 [Clostridia bacterium]|nr:hypothetical protein [Clostridia bacterium]
MNKYKMISICSLTIACVLMLSILLPVKTIANDKESIELSMHYENAQVTANIEVNSDVYSGVVCKYLIIDDILTSDDILAQTRENGTTISLDKSEDDKYTAVIPSVDKRYVVIYVSIGNCSLCDYIDCKPGESSKKETSNEQISESSDESHKIDVVGEGENGQIAEATTDNKNEQQIAEESTTQEQAAEENKQEVTEQPVENKTEQPVENKTEQPVENKTEQPVENKTEQVVKNDTQQQEKKEEKIVVDNTQQTQQSEIQIIGEVASNKEEINKSQDSNNDTQTTTQTSTKAPTTNSKSYDKDSIDVSNKNNNTTNTSSGNKNTIDTTDFEEIEKVISTSTADGNMPQTGEDDSPKIIGIVVFSVISVVSFYKYKTTK